MIRKYFHKVKKSEKDKINWRSHEPTRIEAFSDAVFGFALSLLIISLEVPKTSVDLLNNLRGFLPFSFCFGIIFMIWYWQYKFFRRYGMHDFTTIVLNGVLLFFVLFYVYPLKFVVSGWMIHESVTIRKEDYLTVICIYNGGLTSIYFLFFLMYLNALAKKDELKLTLQEIFETQTYVYTNIAVALIGTLIIVSGIILYSISHPLIYWSFFLYSLMGPVLGIIVTKREKLFKKKFGNAPIGEPHRGTEE